MRRLRRFPAARPAIPVKRDTSFYYSFLVLPAEKRQAILAVWDLCRVVDDAVDEPADVAPQAALAGWREEVARCFGGEPRTPQGRQLQPWIRRFNLPRQPFDELIAGVEMDLHHARYPTFEALYQYCWRVASTVGLICVEIFGYRRPEARDYAVNLGIALQLTNIVRDVATDLERGRIYLPQADLALFGCREEDLRQRPAPERLRALIEFECGRAREYFAQARALLPREDRRSLVAPEIMGGIYREILRRIEAARYDVLGADLRVPRARRARIAFSVWARTHAGLRVPA